MTSQAIALTLGRKKPIVSTSDMIRLTRKGLPSSVVHTLATAFALERATVSRSLGISDRTLTRRISTGARLSMEESDRAVRFARVLTLAVDTLGDKARASRWLQTPNRALDGDSPMSLLDTDAGVRAVETTLGHIAYGLYA